jgi:hypothetical protein
MNEYRVGKAARLIGLVVGLVAALVGRGHAQGNDQFGGQFRADAASQMIVLGVQQGISSLPPTSGQAFTYDYNAELGTFVASEQLGPTVLRAPQTIGANRLSLRAAVSYFSLSKTFDAIPYKLTVPQNSGFPPDNPGAPTYAEFGMSASAHVTLLNFAATYGITDRLEVSLNVPVTVVQAQANQLYTVRRANLALPPAKRPLGVVEPLPGQSPQQALNAAKQLPGPNGLVVASSSFNALGFNFNEGTHAGVGRISVGAKMPLYDSELVEVAFQPEFYCNSPSQNEFSGSNSPALLARVITQVNAAKHLHVHVDIGDDHDFEVSQLSRFVWNAGVSVPLTNWTIDTGFGGSKFDKGIVWTPPVTQGLGPPVPAYPNGIPGTLTALNPNATVLGTNYVDYLFGIKVKLLEGTVLSGAVNVPITDAGFQPIAVGTLALEYYF